MRRPETGRDGKSRSFPKLLWMVIPGAAVLILLGVFLAAGSGGKTDMTAEALTERLTALCGEYGTGVYTGEGGSRGFAGLLGARLFGGKDVYESWERQDSVPQIKAAGLRVGDIVVSGDHAAVLYSVSGTGEIRTAECRDGDPMEILTGGYFQENPDNAAFEALAERGGTLIVYHAPNNTSPVLWSARMTALPEEPEITDARYPSVLSNGQFFGLRGIIRCRYPMTEIRAVVTNRVTGEVIFNIAVAPEATVYAIGDPVTETINDSLVFNSPECANSWLNYRVTVQYEKDGKAESKVVLDQNFKVGTPLTECPD